MLHSLISGISFGFLPVFGKLAYEAGMDVRMILMSRFLPAAVLFGLWLAITDRKLLRPGPKTLLKAAALGMAFYPLQSWLFMSAVKLVPASTPTLILYFYPVMVTLLCAVFFGQTITRRTWISLGMVTLGCCLVFLDAFCAKLSGAGLLLAVGAMVVFSAYLVAVQVLLKGENPMTMTFYVFCAAALVWTFAAGGPGVYLAMSTDGLLVALGLGIVTGVSAVVFLYKAIELIGSPMASIFSTVEPAAAVLASWLLLGDQLTWFNLAGMALIIPGIVWPNLRLLKRAPEVT